MVGLIFEWWTLYFKGYNKWWTRNIILKGLFHKINGKLCLFKGSNTLNEVLYMRKVLFHTLNGGPNIIKGYQTYTLCYAFCITKG